jgi:predicted DNA-binding antitoxin AbrB/MazE fold protein
MPQALRAIYNKGQLQLLDAVKLVDGQEIQLFILSDTEVFRSILGDLLLEHEAVDNDELDEAALLQEIETGFAGQPSLSKNLIVTHQESS